MPAGRTKVRASIPTSMMMPVAVAAKTVPAPTTVPRMWLRRYVVRPARCPATPVRPRIGETMRAAIRSRLRCERGHADRHQDAGIAGGRHRHERVVVMLRDRDGEHGAVEPGGAPAARHRRSASANVVADRPPRSEQPGWCRGWLVATRCRRRRRRSAASPRARTPSRGRAAGELDRTRRPSHRHAGPRADLHRAATTRAPRRPRRRIRCRAPRGVPTDAPGGEWRRSSAAGRSRRRGGGRRPRCVDDRAKSREHGAPGADHDAHDQQRLLARGGDVVRQAGLGQDRRTRRP